MWSKIPMKNFLIFNFIELFIENFYTTENNYKNVYAIDNFGEIAILYKILPYSILYKY